jgi:heme/copper-type cytochrome/quinol oxidase subunit 1
MGLQQVFCKYAYCFQVSVFKWIPECKNRWVSYSSLGLFFLLLFFPVQFQYDKFYLINGWSQSSIGWNTESPPPMKELEKVPKETFSNNHVCQGSSAQMTCLVFSPCAVKEPGSRGHDMHRAVGLPGSAV